MQVGIVGLPNVGKSTLFNAITQAGALAANFPFATIEPNVGIVAVPDDRLAPLAAAAQTTTIIPATVRFSDIAGLVRGAHAGEGLGNQFLHHIREVDAIAHVLRCFDDPDVVHVEGRVDPLADAETVGLELVFADQATVRRRTDRVVKTARSGDASARAEQAILEALLAHLETGAPARAFGGAGDEGVRRVFAELSLLTAKPVIYVANVAEDEAAAPGPAAQAVAALAEREGAVSVALSAGIEDEIGGLAPEERAAFLADLGLEASGLDRFVGASYRLLDLITFFTAGRQECRAWTLRRGQTAVEAAGSIHTDLARGFIRAEVMGWRDYVDAGSEAEAKARGLLRIEGRDYVMADGDVVHVRFNV